MKSRRVIIVVLFVLYLINLGFRPLGVPDEGRYAEIPREMLATHNFITPMLNSMPYFEKPALFYWLQSLSLAAFGLQEWAVRLVNATHGTTGYYRYVLHWSNTI